MRNSQLSGYVFAVLFLASIFLHDFDRSQVVALLILLSYFPLFSGYEAENPSIDSFVSFLLVGLAALVYPPVMWLVPAYWIGLAMLRAFSLKSFVASMFGLVIPWSWIVALDSVGLRIQYLHHCISYRMPQGAISYCTFLATGRKL